MKKQIIGCCAAVMLTGAMAAGKSASTRENEFGIFGVRINRPNDMLTREVVQAASDAAGAFGLQKQHQVTAVPGTFLQAIFDPSQLTAVERTQYEKYRGRVCQNSAGRVTPCDSDVQPAYILVTGVFDGGCIAKPVWSLPGMGGKPSKPAGVTDMRCSKSADEFKRLLHVTVPRD